MGNKVSKSIRNSKKEQSVFALYNQRNANDAKERRQAFNFSKYYIKSEDEKKAPVTTENGNKLYAKSGKLEDKYFNIDKNKSHLTATLAVHGHKEFRAFFAEQYEPARGLIDDFFSLFKEGDIESKKSFYFKTLACHGAYHDGTKTIFDKIQEILKNCKGEPPKCFVKIGKKDFPLCISRGTTNGKKIDKKVLLPMEKEPERGTDEEYSAHYNREAERCYTCYINPAKKDKYFDYYYVTKDAIYKVPHELVHNRVKLIDEGKFDKEFKKTQNIDINTDEQDDDKLITSKIATKVEFKGYIDINTDEQDDDKLITSKIAPKVEFKGYKKLCDDKHLKDLRDAAPKTLKDFY